VRLDQLHKRLDRLQVTDPGRRCECPREPPKPIEASPGEEIVESPPVNLPCGRCGGLITVVYMQRVIPTTPETKKADLPAEDRPAGEAAVG
jgi:hypothetical protein